MSYRAYLKTVSSEPRPEGEIEFSLKAQRRKDLTNKIIHQGSNNRRNPVNGLGPSILPEEKTPWRADHGLRQMREQRETNLREYMEKERQSIIDRSNAKNVQMIGRQISYAKQRQRFENFLEAEQVKKTRYRGRRKKENCFFE